MSLPWMILFRSWYYENEIFWMNEFQLDFVVVNEYKIDFYVKQNIESINLSTLV